MTARAATVGTTPASHSIEQSAHDSPVLPPTPAELVGGEASPDCHGLIQIGPLDV